MPYHITSQCIQCDRCFSNCPSQAVHRDSQQYWIDANQCNGCEGTFSVPQCWAVCPTNDGCISFAEAIAPISKGCMLDYWDSWFDTYNRLVVRMKRARQSEYWSSWFDSYSSVVSRLRSQPN